MSINDSYSVLINADGKYWVSISITCGANDTNVIFTWARGIGLGSNTLISYGSRAQTSNICTAFHLDEFLAGDRIIVSVDQSNNCGNVTSIWEFVPDNFEIQQLTVLNQNLSDLIDVQAATPATNDILQFDGTNWVNVNTPTVSALSYFSSSATSTTASSSTTGTYNLRAADGSIVTV